MTESSPAVVQSAPSRSGWLSALALGVSMVALGVAGFSLERSLHAANTPPSAGTPDLALTKIDALRARLRTLTARQDKLETALAGLKASTELLEPKQEMAGPPLPPATQTPAAPTVAPEDVAALKTEITAVKTQMETTFAEIKTTLAEAQAQMTQLRADDVLAMRRLSYQMLRAEILQGRPYAETLARYRSSLAEDATLNPAFETLDAQAEEGIATKAALYRELLLLTEQGPELQEEVAPKPAPKGEGFWEQTQAGLSSLVRIERLPNAASPIEALEQARTTLALGDVARTRALLESLPEAERAAYAPWLKNAQTRERVLRALKRISTPLFNATPAPQKTSGAG